MTVTTQPAGKPENAFVTMAALNHGPATAVMSKTFAENAVQFVRLPSEVN